MDIQEWKEYWFGEGDTLLALFFVILIFSVVDIVTTLGLYQNPSIEEFNPVMDYFLSVDPLLFVFANLSISLVFALLISRLSVKKLEWPYLPIPLLTVVLIRGIVAVNNVLLAF